MKSKSFPILRNILIFALVAISVSSCSKENSISEELIGDWVYERESFNTTFIIEDLDTEGFITFRNDGTGTWTPSHELLNFELDWDLQSDDQKVSITKKIGEPPILSPSTVLYDLKRMDEDNYTLTYHITLVLPVDPSITTEIFENIILTRI